MIPSPVKILMILAITLLSVISVLSAVFQLNLFIQTGNWDENAETERTFSLRIMDSGNIDSSIGTAMPNKMNATYNICTKWRNINPHIGMWFKVIRLKSKSIINYLFNIYYSVGRSNMSFLSYDKANIESFEYNVSKIRNDNELAIYFKTVIELIDLTPLLNTYHMRGRPAYDPKMMLGALLYSPLKRIYSMRKIEGAIVESLPFKIFCGNYEPDHSTIARFKDRVGPFLDYIHAQILIVAADAGLLTVEGVSIDGTKIKAYASRSRCFSYKRGYEILEQLKREIAEIFSKAMDANSLNDELQREVDIRLKKIDFIEKALKIIEEKRATFYAEEKDEYDRRIEERERRAAESGSKPRGKAPVPPSELPDPSDQICMTDPDSRIMRNNSKGWDQSFNCQLSVDNQYRFIVDKYVTQNCNDKKEVAVVVPRLKKLPDKIGRVTQALVDAGYFSEGNIKIFQTERIDAFIAAGRIKHHETLNDLLSPPSPPGCNASETEKMQFKLRTPEGKKTYGKRKQVVEPVIGIIKFCMGFRTFLRRGLKKVSEDWSIVTCSYNIWRMFVVSKEKK